MEGLKTEEQGGGLDADGNEVLSTDQRHPHW
jgi:hypothetical protein